MRSEGIQIGRIFGIPIFLHTSWFVIFGLITYSFFTEFGALDLKMTAGQQIAVALLTSLLFFASLVFHEMSHSVVAKHYKIPVVSITLFVFGGIARISRDPTRAIEEFNIAVAGPISSLALAVGFGIASPVLRLKSHAAGPYRVARRNQSVSCSVQSAPRIPARWRANFSRHRLGHH